MSPPQVDMLETERYIPLVVIGSMTSLLSILGSASTMYIAYRGGELKTHILQRLLFCLGLANMITASGCLVSPFLAPSDLDLVTTFGSYASCSAVGFFFIVFFQVGAWYNLALSLYFFLVVRRNWREQNFKRYMEIIWHACSYLLTVPVVAIAAANEAINPNVLLNQLCTYGAAPLGCEQNTDIECERSSWQNSRMYYNVGVSVLFVSGVGFLCTFLLWYGVRKTLRRSMNHSFENAQTRTGFETVQSRTSSKLGIRWSNAGLCDDERMRQVSIQSILYSLVYFNTILWSILALSLTNRSSSSPQELSAKKVEAGFYALQVLFWALFPLQVSVAKREYDVLLNVSFMCLSALLLLHTFREPSIL